MTEGYGIPIGSSLAHGAPQEVSLVSFTLHLRAFTRKQLYRRLQQAYASGSLQLVKRLHALLALAQGQSVSDVAEMLSLGEQTVRDYRNQYLCKGTASLVYQAPPGRPSKLTTTHRQQLAEWIKASPQDVG
jgi:DNA-binding NarL/FixJ family response regulator